jgi:hypothetical protein
MSTGLWEVAPTVSSRAGRYLGGDALVNGLQSRDGVFGLLDIAFPILDDHVMIQLDPLLEKRQIMRGHFASAYHLNIGPNRH